MKYGFVNVAAAVPTVKVADVALLLLSPNTSLLRLGIIWRKIC